MTQYEETKTTRVESDDDLDEYGNKKVHDEDYFLMRLGVNPSVTDRLEMFSEEERKTIGDKVREEEQKRHQDPKRIEK